MEFLLLNTFVVIILVVMFLRLKRRDEPMRLNWTPRTPGPYREPSENGSHGEKHLNCLFNYNGHTWDAYEVLGIPVGSSRDAVEAGFRKALKAVRGQDSEEFLKTAYQALIAHWN